MVFIFIQVFLLKVYQRNNAKSVRAFTRELLFWRLWMVLIASQHGYFAVVILIVWNYNAHFFLLLQIYSLFSAFACLQAVINSRIEKTLAFIILVLAKLAQLIVCYTLQPVLLKLLSLPSSEEIAQAALTSITLE